MDKCVFPEITLPQTRIRCLLVDHHTLLRDGVRRLLQDEPDFEVIGEAARAAEAVLKVREHHPDLVLMDIGTPGPSSFDAARLMQRDSPQTRLIFLTMHEDEELVMQGLQAGATGYVLKNTPASKLIEIMRQVHRGGKYVSPELLGKLTREAYSRAEETSRLAPRSSTLTPREREVMKMLAEGYSVKEIAGLLQLSSKTVEAHKFNLMRKLDIHNKAQLVTYAIQKKIVKMPAGA